MNSIVFFSSRCSARLRTVAGFTLIELVVVIVVIAVLAGLAAFGYNSVVGNARTSAAVQTANQLKKVAYTAAMSFTAVDDVLAPVDGCGDEDGDDVVSSVDVAICEAPQGVAVTMTNEDPRRYQVDVNGGVACWATGPAGGIVSAGFCDSTLPDTPTNLVSTTPNSSVSTWGSNEYNQVGNGLGATVSSPVSVDTSGVLANKQVTKIEDSE